MKSFYNFKLGTKLILCFSVITLITSAMGIFGMLNIHSLQKMNQEMYAEMTRPIAQMDGISVAFHSIRVDLRDIILSDDPASISAATKALETDKTAFDERLKTLSGTLTDPDAQEQYLALQEACEAYNTYVPALLALAQQNQDEEAFTMLAKEGEMAAACHQVETLTAALVEQQLAFAKETADQNSKDAVTSSIIMCIVMVAAGLIATFLGLFLNKIVSVPLRILVESANKLSIGDLSVHIKQKSTDEIGTLMGAFGKMVENIKEQVDHAERIAAGDLMVEIVPKSEVDLQSQSMHSVVLSLQNLVKEVSVLTESAINGALSKRGNEDAFTGGYREIVTGINDTLDAVVNPLMITAGYMDDISKGNIPDHITDDYRGDFGLIKENINTCIDAVNLLVSDMKELSIAAVEGDLSIRGDTSRHHGDFAKVVEGVNETLDAIINPLHMASDYISAIGRGEIPEPITAEYQGDFNRIKESINSCIEGLAGLLEGCEVLVKMNVNDFSQTVKGEYAGIYREMADSINAFVVRINRITDVIFDISQGDLHDLEDFLQIGKRCENDRLMPAVIGLMQNIRNLIEETGMLSVAAIKGDLSVRGNPQKFKGEYCDVISGINATMDAVTTPVAEARTVLQEMAHGNLHVRVSGQYEGDHAALSDALNETIDSMQSYVKEIAGVLGKISDGNLEVSITADYKGDFLEIKHSLNQIAESLNEVLGEINGAADQVASGSRQVSEASQTLAQGSTEQASSIQELTASITEIAAQTKKNAVNANQANTLASDAKENAAKGNHHMKEMLLSMEDINASSVNISKIIKVIDDIAFQTNILALNAAVEAARAGQHGKGFAVVAEEVRNLAARSADAARETTDLIEGSVSKVQSGTQIANETAAALVEIVAGVEKAADLVSEIAGASNEQATNIAQINHGIDLVSRVVQNNSATAEESAAASEELSGQAELLKAMTGRFQVRKRQEERHATKSPTQIKTNPGTGTPRIELGDNRFDKY